jgi:hypothetical protein
MGELVCHDGIHIASELLLELVPLRSPDRREHLGSDHLVLEPPFPWLPLLFIEDPVLVLLPYTLVEVEVHLEIPHLLQLALSQPVLRSIRLEGADEVGVVKLQLVEEESGVDRPAVDIPPGRDVGLVELHDQGE